ncbi:MAG: quinone oxidoreductase [Actinobacteria bacterium]|nr:quinone oxidoreductase [Actinomycetota bacterium]
MRAVQVRDHGGPEVLGIEEVDVPEPGPGEVRIEVAAAGVNFIDVYFRTGAYPAQLPLVPGVEAAGTVNAVGPDVTALSVGDRVAHALVPGAYAEQQVVAADRLVAVPDEIELETAAAVMLQGMTAHYLSNDAFPLGEGHTALVYAAAGGVGHLLVQLAARRGARVIGTASTDEKLDLARGFGADDVVAYTDVDIVDAVDELTGGEGVDVVYDSVGATTFDASLECLRPRGCLVLYGQSSGPVQPFDPQTLNRKGSLFLTRPSLAHYTSDRGELEQRAADVFGWIAAGELDVRIDRSLPLAEAAEAHRYLEGRSTRGKLLLVP